MFSLFSVEGRRRDDSSIDSIDHDYLGGNPSLSEKSRLSSTTLSRDSGLYDDSAESELSSPSIPTNKQLYSRSVSNIDESPAETRRHSCSAPPISLSQSYGNIDKLARGLNAPTKPPRKGKRRDSEPPQAAHPPAISGGSRQLTRTHAFRTDVHQKTNTTKFPPAHMRMSMESLSMDSSDSQDKVQSESLVKQHGPEMGTIRRSESGKNLYMDGILYARSENPHGTPESVRSLRLSEHSKQESFEHTVSDSDDTSVFIQPRILFKDESAAPTFTTRPTIPVQTARPTTRKTPKVIINETNHTTYAPEVKPDDVPLAVMSNSKTSMDQSFYHHQATTDSKIGIGSPPPNVLLRHNRSNKAFMTSKGSDLFPTKCIRNVRRSLHEDDLDKNDYPNINLQESWPGVTTKPRPTSMFVSTTDIETLLHSSDLEAPLTKNKRPQHPPSYQEAINRNVKAEPKSVTENDREQQSLKSAKAKRMYAKSLSQFNLQQTEPEPKSEDPFKKVVKTDIQHVPHKQSERVSSATRSESTAKTLKNAVNADGVSKKNSVKEHHRQHRARVREKRAHRNSDTKLQDKAQKNRINVNLSRSKSDSSEHIHRIKFKELKAMENEGLLLTHRSSRSRPDFTTAGKILTDDIRKKPVVASVRNKSWHKDLAQKYSEVFYQPRLSKSETQYAYVKSTKHHENDGETKRRWRPPVHPTKDLVINHDTNRRSEKSLNQNSNRIQNKENVRKNTEPVYRKKVEEHVKHIERPLPPEEESQDEVKWSVSKLRNLYDTKKTTNKQPPPYRKAKQNEESYV